MYWTYVNMSLRSYFTKIRSYWHIYICETHMSPDMWLIRQWYAVTNAYKQIRSYLRIKYVRTILFTFNKILFTYLHLHLHITTFGVTFVVTFMFSLAHIFPHKVPYLWSNLRHLLYIYWRLRMHIERMFTYVLRAYFQSDFWFIGTSWHKPNGCNRG